MDIYLLKLTYFDGVLDDDEPFEVLFEKAYKTEEAALIKKDQIETEFKIDQEKYTKLDDMSQLLKYNNDRKKYYSDDPSGISQEYLEIQNEIERIAEKWPCYMGDRSYCPSSLYIDIDKIELIEGDNIQ